MRLVGLLLRMREPMFWRQALRSGEMLCDLREEKGMMEMRRSQVRGGWLCVGVGMVCDATL